MENNNNQNNLEKEINEKIDGMLKENKELDQIEKEIKELYSGVTSKPVTTVYNAKEKIAEVIYAADKLKENYEHKVLKINVDLKEEKQKELKDRYYQDFRQDLDKLQGDLKRIAKHDAKYKKEARERNLLSTEYKVKRAEAFNILLQLGKVLDEDLVEYLLTPLVQAQDIISLRILEKCSSPSNAPAYKGAVRRAEQLEKISDIEDYLREADKYISKGAGEKHLPLLLQMKKK